MKTFQEKHFDSRQDMMKTNLPTSGTMIRCVDITPSWKIFYHRTKDVVEKTFMIPIHICYQLNPRTDAGNKGSMFLSILEYAIMAMIVATMDNLCRDGKDHFRSRGSCSRAWSPFIVTTDEEAESDGGCTFN